MGAVEVDADESVTVPPASLPVEQPINTSTTAPNHGTSFRMDWISAAIQGGLTPTGPGGHDVESVVALVRSAAPHNWWACRVWRLVRRVSFVGLRRRRDFPLVSARMSRSWSYASPP